MSTILDALRKLQRERAAQHPPRDLRGSITDEIPVTRSPARARRRGLAAGMAVLLVAAVGGAWLYRSGKVASPSSESLPIEGPDGEDDRPATEEEFAQLERETLPAQESEMDLATAVEPETPAVAASPESVEPVAPTDAEVEARAERERLEAVQAEALAAANAQRQAEIEAAARAAAPPAPPAPIAAPVAPTPEPAPEVTPPAPPVAIAAAPQPESKPRPKPKAKPAARPPKAESLAAEPDAESLDAIAPAAFPPVRVESIRWHPLSERRVASLRFEQQNVPDAHEGDIVAGVLVYRIDPGAVELRIGSTSRVIRPVP